MTLFETSSQAQRCAERIRQNYDLAKMEYQCRELREAWNASMAALWRNDGPANPELIEDMRRYSAAVSALQEHIRKARARLAKPPTSDTTEAPARLTRAHD